MLAPAVSRLETHAHTHTHTPAPAPAQSLRARPRAQRRPAALRCPPPGMEYFVVPAQKMPSLQHFRKSEKEVIGGLCRWGRALFRSALFISTFFFPPPLPTFSFFFFSFFFFSLHAFIVF